MSAEPPAQFQLTIDVRSYEVDVNGHVNHAVYHQYAEHARMEHFRAAGLSQARLSGHGATIVLLATTANFRSELLAGEQLTVDSELAFGEGRAFTMRHRIVRTVDVDGNPAGDVLAADVDCTLGVMDVVTRKLLHGPRDRLAAAATDVALLDPR
ncbi:acyl-CoA thioesterase [Pseudonocardia endophytica]|uniref:Acyl-CoA thioester hydrolase n=1 Tax=Pseudonocardia endophytica TaxID=401976 RepID=A0A4R1HX75_PSEEN|nr:acyl-CoA thioesterase [Pseudonocardia endophytica]TCK26081.1 acyl-CoA thioester hydrolase [Pseudonocardia endophytica]